MFARGGGEAAEEERLECECLLVATGRKPNVSGLGLEAAGVAFDAAGGVRVDDTLRTTNPNIYAVGDVCTPFQFTHVAGAMAGIVVENALFGGARRFSSLLVPWCTYTAPEVAHVGLYERDFAARGLRCDTFTTALAHNDRAILEGATDGFVKVHVRRGTDEILGATVVAEHAGEMISELTLAIQNKIGPRAVERTIHHVARARRRGTRSSASRCAARTSRAPFPDTDGRKPVQKAPRCSRDTRGSQTAACLLSPARAPRACLDLSSPLSPHSGGAFPVMSLSFLRRRSAVVRVQASAWW